MFAMCNPKKTAHPMEDNTVDFEFYKEATLTGIYTESTILKRGEDSEKGYFKIVVNDTLEVTLLPPYEKKAIRPAEEVEKYNGKRVTVTGIIVEDTELSETTSIEEQPLSVNIACFITIESIKLAEN
jgi:hypothetical protein